MAVSEVSRVFSGDERKFIETILGRATNGDSREVREQVTELLVTIIDFREAVDSHHGTDFHRKSDDIWSRFKRVQGRLIDRGIVTDQEVKTLTAQLVKKSGQYRHGVIEKAIRGITLVHHND